MSELCDGTCTPRRGSAPVPAGSVFSLSLNLFGPLSNADLEARMPYQTFGFNADGRAWFLYLSGAGDPSAIRHPPFIAGLEIDDTSSPAPSLLSVISERLQSDGDDINSEALAALFDDQTSTLDFLYQDPATKMVRHMRVGTDGGISVTDVGDLYAVGQLDGTDYRASISPGNLAVFTPDQVNISIISVTSDFPNGRVCVKYLLKAPQETTADILVEFDTDDFYRGAATPARTGFRAATPFRTDRDHDGVSGLPARPAGVHHTFVHDLGSDGLSRYDGFIQYRITLQ